MKNNKIIFGAFVVAIAFFCQSGIGYAEEIGNTVDSVKPVTDKPKITREQERLPLSLPSRAREVRDSGVPVIPERKTIESSKREEMRVQAEQKREEMKNRAEKTREEAKERMEVEKEELKGLSEEKRTEIKARLEERKANLNARKQEFETKVETKKEEFKRNVEAKKEELKKKLEIVKDEKKKQTVEKLDEKMREINDKRVSQLTEKITHLDEILVKISSRADKVEANGTDVSVVRVAIINAETVIASARTAVANQASKIYVVTINSEENLKSDVGATRQKLQADLSIVNEALKKALESVKMASQSLSSLAKPTKPVESTTGEINQ